MALEITKASASIKHLNIRKEGPEENKVLACDVKLEVDCNADILAHFDPALRSFMFVGDDCRFPAMAAVGWSGEMRNMELEIAGRSFKGVSLKKFELSPYVDQKRGSRVKLMMQASLKPESNEVAGLAEHVQDDVFISVMPQPVLFQDADEQPHQSGPIVINVDMEKACEECGDMGAVGSGICLKCTNKAMDGAGAMNSAAGKKVAKRFKDSLPK